MKPERVTTQGSFPPMYFTFVQQQYVQKTPLTPQPIFLINGHSGTPEERANTERVVASDSSITALLRSVINTDNVESPLLVFIRHAIKYESLYRMGTGLSYTRYQKSGVEGFHTREVVINVRSDMFSYLQLVRPLRNATTNQVAATSSTRFNPDYHAFQNPTRAMNDLSVDFGDLPGLLKWMEVKDIQDLRSFATKRSTPRSGGLLRVLGTRCTITVSKSDNGNDQVDVDCILPFVSCTETRIAQLKQLLSEDYNESDTAPPPSINHDLRTSVVFFRHRENYDPCQGRFLSPWRARRITWSGFGTPSAVQSPPAVSSSNNSASSLTSAESDTSFTVQWSRCAVLPSATWTEDATFMGSLLMGNISVFFPSVVFFGHSTTAEIRALLQRYCL